MKNIVNFYESLERDSISRPNAYEAFALPGWAIEALTISSQSLIKSVSKLETLKVTISGIRGIVGKDLTLRDVLKFSKNFSTLIDSKKCVIAMFPT